MPARIASLCRRIAPVLLMSVLGAATAAPMRACTVLWPPHTTLAGDGRTAAGLHTEIVLRAMKHVGVDLSIDVVSWERCLKDLAAGYYAAAYGASFREERAQYAVYPREPIDTVRYVAVVRADDGNATHGWDRRHDFSALPQPLAAPRGWSITEEVRSRSGLPVDDNSTHNDQDIRKLLAGRVGTAILEYRTARRLIDELDGGGRLRILDEPVVADRKYYIIFSRKALGEEGARAMAELFSSAMYPAGAAKGAGRR